jgi:hypothetical protein
MSFPETGALPLKEVRALLQLNDLIAAIREWASEAEGQLWAPTELTVSNAIDVASAITPRAGCPAMTPTESATIILDWSGDASWSTIEVNDDALTLLSASHERQTTKRAGTMVDLDAFTDAVTEAVAETR